jgi:cation:H+ antiporter
MILNIVLLIVGFVILIKGADFFVDGASGIAGNFKVPKMLIGLTIVAFGTSAPEFAVSIKSLLVGSGDIVLGNVIGSNIMNILLILGVSAFVHALIVKDTTVRKELPIMLMITLAFTTLLSDNVFSKDFSNAFPRGDGIVLVLFFCVFLYYLISMSRKKVQEEEDDKYPSMKKSILLTTVGMAGIVFGSNFVVDSATALAQLIGISERMISLTVVAFGTSLPELVTSVTATRKGEYDIAIGNVVGSNIFNIGMVIGIPIAVFGGISSINFSYVDILVMILAAVLLFVFSFNDHKISRKESIVFLMTFVAYYSYVMFGTQA